MRLASFTKGFRTRSQKDEPILPGCVRRAKIANKIFAFGFDWLPESALSRNDGAARIRAKGRSLGANLAVFYGNQAGFGRTQLKPARLTGTMAAAARLALPGAAHASAQDKAGQESKETCLAGAFALEDLAGRPFWWVFARAGAENAPGWCDRIFESRDEALGHLQTLLTLLPPLQSMGRQERPEAPAQTIEQALLQVPMQSEHPLQSGQSGYPGQSGLTGQNEQSGQDQQPGLTGHSGTSGLDEATPAADLETGGLATDGDSLPAPAAAEVAALPTLDLEGVAEKKADAKARATLQDTQKQELPDWVSLANGGLLPVPSETGQLLVCQSPEESALVLAPLLVPASRRARLRARFSHAGRLMPLATYRGTMQRIVRLLLLAIPAALLCWQGGELAWDRLEAAGLTPGAARKARLAQERKAAIAENPELLWGRPWSGGVDASVALRACKRLADEAPIAIQGWRWEKSTVKVSRLPQEGTALLHLEASYTKGPGAVFTNLPEGFRADTKGAAKARLTRKIRIGADGSVLDKAWAEKPQRPKMQAAPNASSAAIASGRENTPSATAGNISRTWKDLLTCETSRGVLLDAARSVGATSSIKFKKQAKRREEPAGSFTCPWAQGAWSVRNLPRGLEATNFPERLAGIPGLTLATFSCNGRTWSAEGEIHAIVQAR